MKWQKGQSIVEFAVVLPLFMMLFLVILYSGFMYYDYITLTNVARSSAREAAIGTSYTDIKNYYRDNTHLTTSLYTWQGTDSDFRIEQVPQGTSGAATPMVKVTLNTSLNQNFPAVKGMGYFGLSLPANYSIEYSMHDETADS